MEALFLTTTIVFVFTTLYAVGARDAERLYFLKKLEQKEQENKVLRESLELTVEHAEFKDPEGVYINKHWYVWNLLRNLKNYFPKLYERLTTL